MAAVPERVETEAYLAQVGKELDLVCDVDVGSLVDGHRVIVRGIEHTVHSDYGFVLGLAGDHEIAAPLMI